MVKNIVNGKPIVILGVDRSGTSLVANLVYLWGAYGGNPKILNSSDCHNPSGYFENIEMADFADFVLSKGIEPHIAALQPNYEEDLARRAKDPEYADSAGDLVRQMSSQSEIWFWKDPLLSIQLPFWTKIWGDAAYIITVRNPEDSARSWHEYYSPPVMKKFIDVTPTNIIRWQFYLLSILRNVEDKQRKLFVSYEELIGDPETQLGRICTFLDSYCDKSEDRAERISKMRPIIDKSLWRNRADNSFDDCSDATMEQKALYKFLVKRAEGEDLPFDEELYPMPPGWRTFLTTNYLLVEVFSLGFLANLCYFIERKLRKLETLFIRKRLLKKR